MSDERESTAGRARLPQGVHYLKKLKLKGGRKLVGHLIKPRTDKFKIRPEARRSQAEGSPPVEDATSRVQALRRAFEIMDGIPEPEGTDAAWEAVERGIREARGYAGREG